MPSWIRTPSHFLAWALFWVSCLLMVARFNYFALASSGSVYTAAFFSIMGIVVVWLIYRRFFRDRYTAMLVAGVVAAAFAAGAFAIPAHASTDTVGTTGGVNWNGSPGGIGYGCRDDLDVWHTGNYPVGGFTNYTFHMHVRWCYAGGRITSFAATPSVADERFVQYDPGNYIVSQKNVLYTCDVNGRKMWHGCLYAYVKADISVTTPGYGHLMTAYPWVYVRVNGNGDILTWSWSKQLV